VDVDAFVAAHQPEWDRLDYLVRRRRRLSGAEVDELVGSYQRVTTHLSELRSGGHDPALTAMLSTRLARARAAISGAHAPAWRSVGAFVATGFPAMTYRLRWWWLATAAASLAFALIYGWWVARSPAVQASLGSKSAVSDLVNHQFRNYYSQFPSSAFAFQVWSNNVWVAAEALIFGVLLGVPTLLVLVLNSENLGVDGALMIVHGKTAEFFGLILPHGMLELSAVFLAAAAGLRLGWSVIDPGPRPRGRALAEEGRATVTIALGLIVVLLVSGVIEAFVTPSPLPTWARILVGAVAEAALLSYVLILGRRAERAGASPDMAEVPDFAPVAG
jgi:uncharacterized membrane protein SpoIIM required for sporulation